VRFFFDLCALRTSSGNQTNKAHFNNRRRTEETRCQIQKPDTRRGGRYGPSACPVGSQARPPRRGVAGHVGQRRSRGRGHAGPASEVHGQAFPCLAPRCAVGRRQRREKRCHAVRTRLLSSTYTDGRWWSLVSLVHVFFPRLSRRPECPNPLH